MHLCEQRLLRNASDEGVGTCEQLVRGQFNNRDLRLWFATDDRGILMVCES